MRFPKPFYRKSKHAWYVQLGKRQISLGKEREAAFARYRQVVLHEGGASAASDTDYSVAEIFDLFLEHSSKQHAPETYAWYRGFLENFCKSYPTLTVRELKPFHVSRWMAQKDWCDTTRNKVIGCLKAALNWAVGEGLLADHSLRQLKKPPAGRRERILTGAERRSIMGAVNDRAFKIFLFALGQTGARPGEIRKITKDEMHLNAGVWVLNKHKTAKKTGKPRVIYLTPAMVKLCSRLVREHENGPIFRNTRDRPWTQNAIRMRFRQLRAKLGLDVGVVAYCYRHTYVTDALERGIPDATVAELVGHTSTAVIHRHYSHLAQKAAHLRAAACQAASATT